MRAKTFRMLRLVAVALSVYMAMAWSERVGAAWFGYLVLALALGVCFAVGLGDLRRDLTLRRERRWEAAIQGGVGRARAIAQIRAALRKLAPTRKGQRTRHARLSLLLAELLDAEGDYAEAMAIVDAVDPTVLTRLDRALILHTRAVTHLRGSDPEGARLALSLREPSGDLELDQRLTLLEAYAEIELGDPQHGLAVAVELARESAADPSVVTEAQVVRAAALDAQGRREEALVALSSLGRDTLAPLSELGHPRVRTLAKIALDGIVA